MLTKLTSELRQGEHFWEGGRRRTGSDTCLGVQPLLCCPRTPLLHGRLHHVHVPTAPMVQGWECTCRSRAPGWGFLLPMHAQSLGGSCACASTALRLPDSCRRCPRVSTGVFACLPAKVLLFIAVSLGDCETNHAWSHVSLGGAPRMIRKSLEKNF
jgi:hypothetical protein